MKPLASHITPTTVLGSILVAGGILLICLNKETIGLNLITLGVGLVGGHTAAIGIKK